MLRFVLLLYFVFSLVPVFSQDPPGPAYSIKRYSMLWENPMFASRTDGKPKPTTTLHQGGWVLAGVFLFEGKTGAVILNETTGAVEEIWTGKNNASGVKLLAVYSPKGQKKGFAKVQVEQSGKVYWIASKDEQKTSEKKISPVDLAKFSPSKPE